MKEYLRCFVQPIKNVCPLLGKKDQRRDEDDGNEGLCLLTELGGHLCCHLYVHRGGLGPLHLLNLLPLELSPHLPLVLDLLLVLYSDGPLCLVSYSYHVCLLKMAQLLLLEGEGGNSGFDALLSGSVLCFGSRYIYVEHKCLDDSLYLFSVCHD